MKIRFTIGKKIGVGFGILILLTLIAFGLTLYTLKSSRAINERITNLYTPSVNSLQKLNTLVAKSKGYIHSWISNPNPSEDKKSLRSLIILQYPNLKDDLKKFATEWNQEDRDSLLNIFLLTDDLFRNHSEVMVELNSFESYNDGSVIFLVKSIVEDDDGDINVKTRDAIMMIENLMKTQYDALSAKTDEMNKSFSFLQNVVNILGVALPVGGILIATFTIITIVRPVNDLKKILQNMGKGVLPKEKIQERNDEIGEMTEALNRLVDGLSSTTEFANEVGSGNFMSHYEPLSNDDALGQALLKMREDLRENERVLEQKVIERTEEVVRQKEEIETQNEELEVLYKHVTDSIKYAKRIQDAILPPKALVDRLLPNSFVLFKPKDIVSGDFYWMDEKEGKTLFAAVDCTGHGVPGAFMSIVAYNILKQVVSATKHTQPAAILDGLNKGVGETLHHSDSDKDSTAKDGMDLSLCSIDYKNMELEYAGAFNPLCLVRDGELQQIKADKFPIGFFVGEGNRKFTNHKVKLQKGDTVYLYTDGYADQFGGPNGKKFMVNKFRDLLLQASSHNIIDQKTIFENTIENWRGELDQVDDILLIGVTF